MRDSNDMWKTWIIRAKRPLRFLAICSIGLAVISYASYRMDNRFFFHLGEVILEGDPSPNGKEICLQFLHFSSKIPVFMDSPTKETPWWIVLYYRFNPLKPDPRSVLKYGTDPRGPCGSRSRVLAALLESKKIPARLTCLHDRGEAVHTIVEAECEARWAVLDPTYDLSFQDSSGTLLSAQEVRERPEIFKKTSGGKRGTAVPFHNPYPIQTYTYEDVYPFNWNAIPFVLPALKHLTDLTFPNSEIQQRFRYPSSYRRPKLFFAEISFVSALFFILLGVSVGLLLDTR